MLKKKKQNTNLQIYKVQRHTQVI